MDFKQAAILGSCISKDYAENLFKLLVTYKNISASEAASRLNLHIRTVQDFLEDLQNLEVVDKEEVYEGKRPYFRYTLKVKRIKMEVDLNSLFDEEDSSDTILNKLIRERYNSGARFTTSRSHDHISSVAIWIGAGRDRTERKINLSYPQGKFLFNLPFPTAKHLSIRDIIKKAEIDDTNIPEIVDIVDVLIELRVIESI